MNTCTESIFESIARKLNDRGITLHREGEVEYPDGTTVFKDDAPLLYTDCGVDYRVVKTVHGYAVWNGYSIVASGEDEYDVGVLVSDIYRAVIGTSLFTLADWQQEVADGNTERGYRDWVEAKIEEAAHDRYAALLAKIKAGVADRYTMGRVRKCAADCARASGTKSARFFDSAAESVARATIFG